ncbi:MAG TPA: hypothetical protein VNA22_01710 [Pyrinomonadaceae bacterium]|nr:hypothetical protein [Pyrinomonadaceae bacterium]
MIRLLIVIAFACVLFTTATVNTSAQATRNIVGRRLDDFNKQTEKVARDEMGREMHGRKLTPEERRIAEAKKAQIKEDFEKLQTVYNEILTRLHAKETFSDQYVADTSERVAKSGARLRENIEFPVRTEDEKSTTVSPQSVSIKLLCVQIHAFLTNPIFEIGVLDVTEAAKARDALEKVIKTSEELRTQFAKTH